MEEPRDNGFESFYGKAAAMTKDQLLKEVVRLCEEKTRERKAREEAEKKYRDTHSDGVCRICGEETQNVSANPGKWGVLLGYDGEKNDKLMIYHIECLQQLRARLSALEGGIKEALGQIEENDEMICKLCKIINPQHKNCKHCNERDSLLNVKDKLERLYLKLDSPGGKEGE